MKMRDDFLHTFVTRDHRGIEIGPSYNPIFRKSDGWKVAVVDYLDREGLAAKYAGKEDVSRIEEVDYLVEGSRFSEGIDGKFDYIAASHALEHLVDPIGFFKECAKLLKDGGLVLMAVPDKRFCFDFFRPVSTTTDMIRAHWEGNSIHPADILAESNNLACSNNGYEEWVIEHERPVFKFMYEHDLGELAAGAKLAHGRGEYFDMHRWVFTPASLLFIVRDLASHGLLDFDVKEIERGIGPNIFLVLRKSAKPRRLAPNERVHLHAAIIMEQQVQSAYMATSTGFNDLPQSEHVDPLTQKLMQSSRSDMKYLEARSS